LVNLPSKEWEYIKMPFIGVKIFDIPLAVFLGWMPLVFGTICIVNVIKRVDFVKDKKTYSKTLKA